MKKSLIALAVLAASGAAMAQSSVTLYGIADVWVGNVSVDDGTTDTSTTKMISGGVSTSRWGMKGSEDLGGGLKANFQFEQSVNVDDGTTGAGFSRQAWVGLSGGFGDVRFGVNSTPFDDYAAGSHGVFDSDLAPMNLGAFPTTKLANGGKSPNSIKYVSPSMGGLVGAVSYSMDEENALQTEVISLGLNYAGGPLAAQLVYQQEEVYGSGFDTTFTKLGGSYDFGVAKAKAYFATTSDFKTIGNDVDEWQLAVDVPLSAAMTLSGSYAVADYENDVKTSGYGIALAYSLSKRTTLYGGVGAVTDEAPGKADKDTTAYAIGIKHTF